MMVFLKILSGIVIWGDGRYDHKQYAAHAPPIRHIFERGIAAVRISVSKSFRN